MAPRSSSADRVNSFGALISTWCDSVKSISHNPQQARAEIDTAAEELRTAEEELRQQNEQLLTHQILLETERERYRDLFEMAPDGYLVTDERGIIAEANRAAAAMLSVRKEFLPGKTLFVYLHADDVRTARHQMTLSQQTRSAAEWTARLTPRASPSYPAGITVAPILSRSEKGAVCTGFRWLIRDIFERIRAEMNARALAAEIEELRTRHASALQSERRELSTERARRRNPQSDVRAKETFLALIAHELRNPLGPVLLAVESLLASPEIDPALFREKLHMVRRNLIAERRLVDDLLDFTRIAHGKLELQPESIDLHSLLNELLAESRDALAAKNITLHADFLPGTPLLHADPIRLRQVFWNLINNAIKFTHPKGRVFLRTSLHPLHNQVIIEIEDTGVGISPESLKSLFDPFAQGDSRFARAQGGLGLGLSIVRSLVTAHNGSVSIDSRGVGKGATVRIILPLAEQTPASPPRNGRASSQKSLLICLVDDHLDSVRAMSQVFTGWGHRIVTAHSIADAVKLLDHRTVDLLIADLHLPDGLSTDILQAVPRSHIRHAVALSGAAAPDEDMLCRDAGFEKLVAKPVSMEELQELLHTIV